ncbi:MAG TPA: hypothetical protein VKD24_06055 [Candidatus Angelobacter sp.]|nr:hypothetical protein [Candidatus Angelobacter sp.]
MRRSIRLAGICPIAIFAITAIAWVFPEHRDIDLLAFERLEPAKRLVLVKLWSEARVGHESRLCADIADPSQGAEPACLDYASWPAIAGDHSCSADDMLSTVLDSRWILRVARISAHLKSSLATATRPDQRFNAVRHSDSALLRADPAYVTRAGSNHAHFLLARPDVSMTAEAYQGVASGPNAEMNALAAYMWYHLRALAKAAQIAQGDIPADLEPRAALAVLADEAFALHFLEDSFASGHVAGSWGNSAVRKGTHDYYSEHGLELETWDGNRFVALGDAYMRQGDANRTAAAVRDSLAQVATALEGGMRVAEPAGLTATAPEKFDVCHESRFPGAPGQIEDMRQLTPIVAQMPVPALGPGKGALPRFRSELGPFVGLSSAASAVALGGGFGSKQTDPGFTGGLDMSFRLGLGVEGILNQSSDGLTFLDAGVRQDSRTEGGSSVPGRGAIALRGRAPFWLVPGDLIVAAPVLAFTGPHTLKKMAVQAANGGLIPWQGVIATPVGRFQFVLGREVGISLYGYTSDQTFLIPTPGLAANNITQVHLRSVRVDFPILEYRPFRTFSQNQSSGLAFQFFTGFDKPNSASVVEPVGAPKPALHTIVTGGVRMVFDWRHYVELGPH